LLIFSENAYTNVKHRIVSRLEDEIHEKVIKAMDSNRQIGEIINRGDKRISLTIRKVCKATVVDNGPTSIAEKEESERQERFFYRSITE
jgi:hypothetical protein